MEWMVFIRQKNIQISHYLTKRVGIRIYPSRVKDHLVITEMLNQDRYIILSASRWTKHSLPCFSLGIPQILSTEEIKHNRWNSTWYGDEIFMILGRHNLEKNVFPPMNHWVSFSVSSIHSKYIHTKIVKKSLI